MLSSWGAGCLEAVVDLAMQCPSCWSVPQDQVQATLDDLINISLEDTLTDYPANGTAISQLSETPGTDIIAFQARTSAGTVQLACPSDKTYSIYVTSALLDQDPGCTADYTQWLRFPCPAGTGCAVDWTQ
jgi:hypothetical protein